MPALLLGGCGGSGGGSGIAASASGGAIVIQSVQAGIPVSSIAAGAPAAGPVVSGNSAAVDVVPEGDVPYARMQVWLQINAAGSGITHYDWEIRDWQPSPPNGVLTNFDGIVDIDPSNSRYVVRTAGNRIRYDTATLAQLRKVATNSTQTVVATAWTADGRFASAYFTLNLSEPVGRGWAGVDLDGNGVSDVWEAAYSAAGLAAAGDSDGDGQNNYAESVAGTDPFDPQSIFRLQAIQHLPAARLVRWDSVSGKRYRVETTTNAASGLWIPQGHVTLGTGGPVLAALPRVGPTDVAYRLQLITDNPAVSNAQPYLGTVDTDLDGVSDLDEWAAGTNPFDGRSNLVISSIAPGAAVLLSWPSVRGKYYQVETTGASSGGAWLPAGGTIEGDGSLITAAVEVLDSMHFYRVSVADSDTDSDSVSDWEEKFAGLEFGPWHYRTNFPTDPAVITAIVAATNVINIEPGAPVANVTRSTPGSFVITRTGNLGALTLTYTVSGEATAGVHYAPLPGLVVLPPGAHSAEIPVTPLTDAGLDPSRGVVVTLSPGVGYALGSNTVARVNVLREVPLIVTDFGAVGDGVTDDTSAIQAAIDALEASPTHNTLHFPAGDYRLSTPVWVSTATESWYQLLELGKTELTGRDLLITGDPDAALYSTTSPLRARMLVARAKFRSLTFIDMTWRKDGNPLSATVAEPNGADGVFIAYHDLRRVEAVEFVRCTFDNCHRAVSMSFYIGNNTVGLLRRFGFRSCRVVNPFGSNTINGAGAFGGGQQVLVGPWVAYALYSENLFEGGPTGSTDPLRNPGGVPKDGSHFGGPLRLVFTNNVVRRMGVEGVYQTDEPFFSTTASTFIVPPEDGITAALVAVQSYQSTIHPGQLVNIRTPQTQLTSAQTAIMRVVAYNTTNRILTLTNPGITPGLVGVEIPAGRPIFLQDYQPTFATIADNVILDGAPNGFIGIASLCKATITRNFIGAYATGIKLAQHVRNPINPPTPGTWVASNVILCSDSTTGFKAYGVQSYGPGEIISDNLVVIPVSTRSFGVLMRGADSWVEGNTIASASVVRQTYASVERSVG
ncbi:MAG: hypothetical protein MUE94_12590, partial [Verrucomicrobia bacterium]|nr:hypothetical protein [Verrucomicrobiota bacterium]